MKKLKKKEREIYGLDMVNVCNIFNYIERDNI